MTSSSPSCPFLAGPMIKDTRFFVGREAEIQTLITQMTTAHPTSVNVVGRRRIGKSSLLYHFFQTYEQRLSQPNNRFVAIYLSLHHSQCRREEGFYQAIGRSLYSRPFVQKRNFLAEPLKVKPFNRSAFSNAIGIWKRHGILPVLCLDEFEILLRYADEFNDSFFNYLRSLLDSEALTLVIASHRNLDFYRHRHKLTSTFFNFTQILPLGELTELEARNLVRLPVGKFANAEAALTSEEQKFARQLGGCHPYLLQLAASLIWQGKNIDEDVYWVKTRFEREARRVPGYTINFRHLGWIVRLLFWLPVNVGKLVRGMGGTVDEIGNLITGTVILLAIALIILGVINWVELRALLEKILS